VLAVDVPALITMAVDYTAKTLKGYINGVEQASTALQNTTDIVNVDSNRNYLFRSHALAAEYCNAILHRAALLHDKTDLAGIQTMENWVKEFMP
jgi:hypothetical protein